MRKTGLICTALVAIYFAAGARYKNAMMPVYAGDGGTGEVCSPMWSIPPAEKPIKYPDESGYWFAINLPGCAYDFAVHRSPPAKAVYKKGNPKGALKKIGGNYCVVKAMATAKGGLIGAFATSEKLCNTLLFALTNKLPAKLIVTAKGMPPKDLSDVTKLPSALGIEDVYIPLTNY